MTFTNGWAFELTGQGYYDPEMFPYRTERAAKVAFARYCAHMGYENLDQYFDKIFQRMSCVPPNGAIVARRLSEETATGSKMGIMSGSNVAFVGTDSLSFSPFDPKLDRAWRLV